MDPSLSFSSDPSPPPPILFSTFPNDHVFQPQTQTSSLPQNQNHPSYSDMICAAISSLNELDGSSKMAISRCIERFYPNLPSSHGALLSHHLKTLKSSGVLTMVKKSYKFAVSPPPASVSAAAANLEASRSENLPINNTVNDPVAAISVSGSASQPLKRGRGRPPKPKPEAPQQQQQSDVQTNKLPVWAQCESSVAKPTTEEGQVTESSAKRGPGRPRKNGSAPIVQASVMAGIMKRRGRPPGRRAAGRQRKPKSVSSTVSVFPFVANGARRRGRPRRVVDSSGVNAVAPVGGQVVQGMKRGRGRPPKIGGVMNRLITKPKRGRGRPVGRPRKNTTWPVTGTQDPAYGELKRKFDLFQEKTREIVDVLKAGVISDNQAVMQAIQDLGGLVATEMVESRAKEEAAPQAMEEEATQTETRADQETEEEEHTRTLTEAEAMQEALF